MKKCRTSWHEWCQKHCLLKTFRIMKLSTILLLLATWQLFASSVYSQETEFTLELGETSVGEVLDEIENQSEFYFLFNQKLVDTDRELLSVQMKDKKINEVLDQNFAGNNTEYMVMHIQIVLTSKQYLSGVKGKLQPGSVSGKVIDENGLAMPGASVSVKGTSLGVVTDMDGNYRIVVDESATLVFSFVGYLTVEEAVAGRTEINVSLSTDATALDEVVVTGYQTLSKERVTGSFETLTADVIRQRPTNNFISSLDGLASGVTINEGKVEIRGRSTILGNANPLYVVDGFPLASSTLTVNPEDIETITVLKDAAASSIWGVRASNGVIVVTTKKGSKKGTHVEFSAFVELGENVDFDKRKWMSTADEIDLFQEYWAKGWYKGVRGEIGLNYPFTLQEEANIYLRGYAPNGETWTVEEFDAYIDELKTMDLPSQWEEHMSQRSIRQTYNFSVSGGGENNSIYASVVYNNNQPISQGNHDSRVILNIRDEFRLKDRFVFHAGINTSFRNNDKNGYWPSAVESIKPYEELVDDSGTPIQYYKRFSSWASKEREELPGNYPYTFSYLDEKNNRDRTQEKIDMRAQFGVGIKIIEGLHFDSKFQYEVGSDNEDHFASMDLPSQRVRINDFYLPDEYDADSAIIGYQIPVGIQYDSWRREYFAWDFRNTLSFDRSWNEHQISVFGGTETRQHYSEGLKSRLYGYDKQTTNYIPVSELAYRSGDVVGWDKNIYNSGAISDVWNSDIREVSFFSNVGYTFRSKYSLTGSYRVDQKNLFGSDPQFRYKPLWSAGASWQIYKEAFMQGIDVINRMTLRITYGLGGNASNEYSPYPQAIPQIRAWGNNIYDFLRLDHPANDQLKWEETATLNIGVDFSLLGNRLGGSIEFYNKNSTDLLGDRPLDPTNGFVTATVNYASMNNIGTDISLRGILMETGGFVWDARLLFSYNKNEVTDVVNENIVPVWLAYQGALRVGQPLDNLYSFDYAGLSDAGDVLINTAENGTMNWRDYKGTETEEDLIYWGTSKAPIYGGFSTSLTYKGFELNLNLSYKFNYKFKHYYTVGVDGYYYDMRMDDIWTQRWIEPGDELNTRIPKISYNGKNPYSGVKEFWWDSYDADWYWMDSQDNILDGGYIKMKDIILAYSLPGKVLSKTKFKSLRISVQVSNAFTWVTNDLGIDPTRVDFNPNSSNYRKSVAAWSGLRTLTFGLRTSF